MYIEYISKPTFQFADITINKSGFTLKPTANAVDSVFVIRPKGLLAHTV